METEGNIPRSRTSQKNHERRKKKKKIHRNTKAHIQIESLNVRGRFSEDGLGSKVEKIAEILPMMSKRKIGILALQETHYTADYVASITERFGQALHVEYSAMPGRQAARAGGVALIFYKPIANVIGIEKKTIIPGRAMVVRIPWHGDDILNVHVGYAPNSHNENKEYWESLEQFYRENPQWKPDVACFDTNIVTDALDRLPAHEDHQGAVKALESFLKTCNLVDGWREENPNVAAFTYTQLTTPASHSRIDRIYIKRNRLRQSRNWDMAFSAFDGVPTDHKRVSCEITTAEVPQQGHGRYTLPIFSVKTRKITKMINNTGITLLKTMREITEAARTQEHNPQTLYDMWKKQVGDVIRTHARQHIPKAKKEILDLEEELEEIINDDEMDEQAKVSEAGAIHDEIVRKGGEIWKEKKTVSQANQAVMGETNSKYYSRLIKGQAARDPVMMLKKPGTQPVEYEKSSRKMAAMMKDYHSRIQTDGINQDSEERKRDTQEVFQNATRKLTEEQKERMSARISRQRVRDAMMGSKPNTGAGLDGWQYEIHQYFNKRWEQAEGKPQEKHTFDIVGTLTTLYEDIEDHGLLEGSTFADGWMCPIFKKKDRSAMENYRPITLLNTDLKIYTKALSVKLAEVATDLIHEDQAGFVRGRSITDQIKLARSVIYHADATNDKISHDYLYQSLEACNLPERFINTIRSLYTGAQTLVIVNGN